MALTRDYKETINRRVQKDPEFAAALLDEAITLFINGEADVARLVLRDLVNSTVGFDTLAKAAEKPNKSLQRMLSAKGNPNMESLATIFKTLKHCLKVNTEVHTRSVAV